MDRGQGFEEEGRSALVVGILKIYALMGSEPHRNILEQDYAFDEHAFHKLVGSADVFRPMPPGAA